MTTKQKHEPESKPAEAGEHPATVSDTVEPPAAPVVEPQPEAAPPAVHEGNGGRCW